MMDCRKMAGNPLNEIRLEGAAPIKLSECLVPGEDQLFNFITGNFLVLDPYGNEDLSQSILAQVFPEEQGFGTLTMNISDGLLYQTHFSKIRAANVMYLTPLMPTIQVPKKYRTLAGLRVLLAQKKPFRVTVDDLTVFEFLDHWSSYQDIKENLVIELNYKQSPNKGFLLQLWGKNYRELQLWKEC